ncbi:YhfT family protein [Coprothermobacter platensis]|uniref:YhfT family protein n=1 Tax=Coprothermobacter platensis TaxID=108819 RepID=UPI0003610FF3|nr:YhfT family protein [Coprothermobacter platensis]
MVLKLVIVAVLCALTSLASHYGRAVFHDGIRPIMPEYNEGRMKRGEMASVAFGLSAGFILSMGFAFTISSGLLNPWLLFLPTDILGIVAPYGWLAGVLGAVWGVGVTAFFDGLHSVLSILPVNMLDALGALSSPVIAGFALFPALAVLSQFGWQRGVATLLLELVARQLAALNIITIGGTSISPEALEMFVGVILLVVFAIAKDSKRSKEEKAAAKGENIFTQNTLRIFKSLPLLMVIGGLVSLVSNMQWFAGSEVDFQLLHQVYASGTMAGLSNVAAADFVRGLAFIPLIVTTSLASGVYGVVGLTFVYPVGYWLAPALFGTGIFGHIMAFVLGAGTILLEVSVLRLVGEGLGSFPSLREASDNIRSAMNNVLEVALLIGSALAVLNMNVPNATGQNWLGFGLFVSMYMINEYLGRPLIRMAASPLAAIVTGILLNVFYLLHLL